MLESILVPISAVLTIVIGITILIFIHELGHFIMAKRAKVRVEAFAIGFGPKLLGITRGGTEYKICMIPLGGYVKMAGESMVSDEATGSPDEFISKPPLTRISIFAAGVVMNFLFAFPACILMYLLGVNFSAPNIGGIQPDSSEWNSSLREGDKIISANNQTVNSLEDYRRTILRLPIGTKVDVKAKRQNKEFTTKIIAQGSKGFGIDPLVNVISKIENSSSAEKAGLQANDEILEIDGVPIYNNRQVNEMVHQKNGQAVNVKISRNIRNANGIIEPSIITISIVPKKISLPLYDVGAEGVMPVIVDSIKNGSPAESCGIKPRDRVVSINGTAVPSWSKFKEILKANAGKEVALTVLRNDKEQELKITSELMADGAGYIGITLLSNNIIGEITKGSPLETAGLIAGDKIIKINGQGNNDLMTLMRVSWQNEGKPITVEVQRGNTPLELNIIPQSKPQWVLGVELKPKIVHQKYAFAQAVSSGVYETIDLFGLTFQLIWKLVSREESTKGLAGPIGIFKISYTVVKGEGISKFLWLLALFSLNLAILNLLPIPILDGGGILFNLIEKFKGSPVSLKIQVIAQYIGLFLILSLVVFATYNDIHRWIFGL